MKIAVTAAGKTPDSEIDPRFGRTQYILVFDSDQRLLEVIDNSANSGAMSGAGIQTAKSLADRKVNLLVTGRVGPNAATVLNAAGIKVTTDQTGTVRDALERLNRNEAPFAQSGSFTGSSPLGGGLGPGRRGGGGRGGGCGGGGGRGGGSGRGRSNASGSGRGRS